MTDRKNVPPVWLLEYAVKSLQSPEDIITDDVLYLYNSFMSKGFSENFSCFATSVNLGRWALKELSKESVVHDIISLPIDFDDILKYFDSYDSIDKLVHFLLSSDRKTSNKLWWNAMDDIVLKIFKEYINDTNFTKYTNSTS